MGYQALLFCPDEKLARVVSQVFSELEFAVDHVTEPFVAVKKLMAQRYDAIVVDCDNEQNSSLLLKSARTSSMNQGSLAIAMVEGQAGVANAYRIGANLVITKPINVEQTKGTLRVARGLLRKTADAAASSTNTTSAVPKEPTASPVRSAPPATRPIEIVAAPPVAARPVPVPAPVSKLPQFEAPLQAVASAKFEEKPAPVVTPVTTRTPVLAPPISAPAPSAVASVTSEVKGDAAKPAPVRAVTDTFTSQSAASAPAPAREAVTQAPKEAEDEILDDFTEVEAPAPKAKASVAEKMTDGPSFAAIGEDSGGSGSKKLMVAAAVLVFAAAGYIGWTKFSGARSESGTQVSAPAPQTQAAPAVVVPSTPTPTTASPVIASNRPSAAVSAPAPKNSPTASAQQPVSVASVNTATDLQPKKPTSAPLIVKSTAPSVTHHAQGEESSQLPSALAVAPSGASPLGAVLSSAPSSVPKLSASRIRVSQGVSQGLVIKRVQPKYPANALSAHIEGAVQIEATINKEGIVVNPKVLSGEPTLAAAAVEAVRQWRYKPYYLDGDPVEIQTQITVNFKAH